jgi:hypothetical protein
MQPPSRPHVAQADKKRKPNYKRIRNSKSANLEDLNFSIEQRLDRYHKLLVQMRVVTLVVLRLEQSENIHPQN